MKNIDKNTEVPQSCKTAVISCLSDDEKLKIAWAVLEWVGYERGFEFDDDNVMEVLKQNSL
jgi:hypothetical protein